MEIPRHWRLKDARLKLKGVLCENNHPIFPPRPICENCGGITQIHPDYKKGLIYKAKGGEENSHIPETSAFPN
jgi:hypothetical protein